MLINKSKFNQFLSDPDKKTYLKIIFEAIRTGIREKELPRHYFSKLLYRKDIDNYLDYIGSFRGLRIAKGLKEDNDCLADILGNKLYFNYFFEDKEVKIPRMIGYNHENIFVKDNLKVEINNKEEFISLMKSWNNGRDIFMKPIGGRQGQDCHKLKVDSNNFVINDDEFKKIASNNYIYQEVIIQHEEINKIYKDAVNPLRIITYLDEKKNIHYITAFMTFGLNKTDVSNNSSGGIFVPVNIDAGKLESEAVQYLEYGGLKCTVHPNSKIEFNGFKIPYFEESLKMINKAIEYLPAKLIGWDIAITSNGPCIIEGNSTPSMASADISYGGLKAHPIFGDVIRRFK